MGHSNIYIICGNSILPGYVPLDYLYYLWKQRFARLCPTRLFILSVETAFCLVMSHSNIYIICGNSVLPGYVPLDYLYYLWKQRFAQLCPTRLFILSVETAFSQVMSHSTIYIICGNSVLPG